jgi:hypothetical protein
MMKSQLFMLKINSSLIDAELVPNEAKLVWEAVNFARCVDCKYVWLSSHTAQMHCKIYMRRTMAAFIYIVLRMFRCRRL